MRMQRRLSSMLITAGMCIFFYHDFYSSSSNHCSWLCTYFCSGQNKNNYLLFYLCWRVMSGLNQEIELNFLIAGHTKFSPDQMFGIFKRRFRVTYCSSLDHIVQVIIILSILICVYRVLSTSRICNCILKKAITSDTFAVYSKYIVVHVIHFCQEIWTIWPATLKTFFITHSFNFSTKPLTLIKIF